VPIFIGRGAPGSRPAGFPTKQFSGPDEKLWKHLDRYRDAQQRTGGVMDIVIAFLALISIGVFAAHTLDALRTG
jgi:hypothetical protein